MPCACVCLCLNSVSLRVNAILELCPYMVCQLKQKVEGTSSVRLLENKIRRQVSAVYFSMPGRLSLRYDIPPSPDKPYLGAGQAVSTSGGPERRARDKSGVFSASLCDWKEDQGSPSENIRMPHLPPHTHTYTNATPAALIPARNFPTHYRPAHSGREEGQKKIPSEMQVIFCSSMWGSRQKLILLLKNNCCTVGGKQLSTEDGSDRGADH